MLARANVGVWVGNRRTPLCARLVALLAVGLLSAACSASDASSDAELQESASLSTSPSPEPAGLVLSSRRWKVENVNIEDRVVGLKGEEAAQKAKDLMVQMAEDYVFNGESIRYDAKDGKVEGQKWMLSARKDMTSDAAADWTRIVTTYFREKKLEGTPAWNSMIGFTSWGLYSKADMRPTDTSKPLMFDMTIKNMDIDLSNDGRIWVSLESSAKFNYVNDGKPSVAKADRTQEFWLKEVDGQMKIDGWRGNIDIADVKR